MLFMLECICNYDKLQYEKFFFLVWGNSQFLYFYTLCTKKKLMLYYGSYNLTRVCPTVHFNLEVSMGTSGKRVDGINSTPNFKA